MFKLTVVPPHENPKFKEFSCNVPALPRVGDFFLCPGGDHDVVERVVFNASPDEDCDVEVWLKRA